MIRLLFDDTQRIQWNLAACDCLSWVLRLEQSGGASSYHQVTQTTCSIIFKPTHILSPSMMTIWTSASRPNLDTLISGCHLPEYLQRTTRPAEFIVSPISRFTRSQSRVKKVRILFLHDAQLSWIGERIARKGSFKI